jgi:hypothetical protein
VSLGISYAKLECTKISTIWRISSKAGPKIEWLILKRDIVEVEDAECWVRNLVQGPGRRLAGTFLSFVSPLFPRLSSSMVLLRVGDSWKAAPRLGSALGLENRKEPESTIGGG